ncbi:MAG: DUF3592 domain-containing protein [Anaerolineae bacterium]|nr:MAG: DUF3592 domain-containing protein [Anaerolineae bacterium]
MSPASAFAGNQYRIGKMGTSKKYTKSGLWFGLGMMLIGIVTLCAGLFTMTKDAGSAEWPATEGTVIYATVEETTRTYYGGKGRRTTRTVYTPRIEYRYTVDGQTYTNTTIGAETSDIRSGIYAGEYAPGKPITVYYNPENPSDAVLVTGVAGSSLAPGCLGMFFVIGGVALTLQESRKIRRMQKEGEKHV